MSLDGIRGKLRGEFCMEFIKFIFSGFWIWLGFFFLLSVVISGFVSITKTIVIGLLGKSSKSDNNKKDAIKGIMKEEG